MVIIRLFLGSDYSPFDDWAMVFDVWNHAGLLQPYIIREESIFLQRQVKTSLFAASICGRVSFFESMEQRGFLDRKSLNKHIIYHNRLLFIMKEVSGRSLN